MKQRKWSLLMLVFLISALVLEACSFSVKVLSTSHGFSIDGELSSPNRHADIRHTYSTYTHHRSAIRDTHAHLDQSGYDFHARGFREL